MTSTWRRAAVPKPERGAWRRPARIPKRIHSFAGQLHAILISVVLGAFPALAADRGPGAPRRAGGSPAAASVGGPPGLSAARAAQRRHAAELLARPGVVATGVGLDPDGTPVLRVFTEQRGVSLPARVEGVRVRARLSGRLYALRGATCESSGDAVCASTERWPLPVPTGVSVGHPEITAGTIGARVTDGAGVFALSNNHVLANVNLGQIGDPALQPGTFDGGSVAAGDAIGTLSDFEPIAFCDTTFLFPVCSQSNFYDAAVAVSSPAELGFATPTGELGSPAGYGVPNPLLHPAYGNPAVIGDEALDLLLQVGVQKYGRTSGLTRGVVDTIQLTADVCYDAACTLIARFEDQLAVPGSFSAGGDSGSLVVTDDGFRHPVGLLFAGSETQTIVSPIDRVLLRFGVTIDDGGATVAIRDAAVQGLVVPSFAVVNQTTTVGVDVRNSGTEPLPAFDVVFTDTTESGSSLQTAPALAPGGSARLDFDWTPGQTGPHDLTAELQLADDDPGNDQAAALVDVLLEPPGLSLRLWKGSAATDAWTTVTLDTDYGSDMVVVCTPRYDAGALGPVVARVRNASGSSFEVGLGRPWFGALPGEHVTAEVHCMVVRAGVYDVASSGVRMEAVRLDGFAAKDDTVSWVGQARSYGRPYTQPVVLGQVISQGTGIPGELDVWSAFWARGATAFDPPSATSLFVGRHTGEDFLGARPAETLAYVVVEAGSGWMDGRAFVAGVGPDSVRGVEDAPPYTYPLSFLTSASHAVASPAGMDGVEGGWPILYGANAVTANVLRLAFEEDWFFDPERSHPDEQVGYVVFGLRRSKSKCGLGFELALAVALAVGLRRLRRAGSRPRRRERSAVAAARRMKRAQPPDFTGA